MEAEIPRRGVGRGRGSVCKGATVHQRLSSTACSARRFGHALQRYAVGNRRRCARVPAGHSGGAGRPRLSGISGTPKVRRRLRIRKRRRRGIGFPRRKGEGENDRGRFGVGAGKNEPEPAGGHAAGAGRRAPQHGTAGENAVRSAQRSGAPAGSRRIGGNAETRAGNFGVVRFRDGNFQRSGQTAHAVFAGGAGTVRRRSRSDDSRAGRPRSGRQYRRAGNGIVRIGDEKHRIAGGGVDSGSAEIG